MKSTDDILKLAEKFEEKLLSGLANKYAQQSSQPANIEEALKTAGLFDKVNEVAPLLSTFGISDDTKVTIGIVVHKDLSCTYPVVLNPNNPAQALKLANALRAKYGATMKAALAAARIQVADTMEVGWLTF